MSDIRGAHIVVSPKPSKCRVVVDGCDLSAGISGISLDAPMGAVPKLTLTLPLMDAATIDGEMRVMIPEETRATLIALGWISTHEIIGFKWTDPATGQVHLFHPQDVGIAMRAS